LNLEANRKKEHMTLNTASLANIGLLVLLTGPGLSTSLADENATPNSTDRQVRALYKQLVDAENTHDIDAVRQLVWRSSATLFVAKTSTPAEGGWAGFWGTESVIAHMHELFQGTFVMQPDYAREKVVAIDPNVAEVYVPLNISVS
jgi:hypothetical protein